MKPIFIIKGPMFSTEEDERAFKKRLDEMRQDGYHVVGITSNKEERIAFRVFKTGWFSQLLEFLKDRSTRRGWQRATEHRRERDLAIREIKRLQELALSYGAPPHHVHLNKRIVELMNQNRNRHIIYSPAGEMIPAIVTMALILLASCAPRAVAFRNHPLPPAYVARKATIGVGKIVVMDLQIIKR